MTYAVEAVYEKGVFRPLEPVALEEGQRVALSVKPQALSPAEADAKLRAWQEVYAGLSAEDVEEVERIALAR